MKKRISDFNFLAIKYQVPTKDIPNPGYRCTYHQCAWNHYLKYVDWGFYLDENGNNITGCAQCMEKCDADKQCSSLECGKDQPFLDGTVKRAHCSYWYNGVCEKAEEFTLNPRNYIWTCLKTNTGTLPFFTVKPFSKYL